MKFSKTVKILLQIMIYRATVVHAEKRRLKFETFPPTRNWVARRCAIDTLDNMKFRGTKFDIQSGSCESLSESWFANRTFEDNTIYFKIQLVEIPLPIPPIMSLMSGIPKNFVHGSSFVFYLRTGESTYYGETAITIGTESLPNRCLYLLFRNYDENFGSSINIVVLTNYVTEWGHMDVLDQKPFDEPNTDYKLEIMITSIAIEVYIDDERFTSFRHRENFVDCNQLQYESKMGANVGIRCFQFQYPM